MIIVTDLLIIDHIISVSVTLPYLPLVFIHLNSLPYFGVYCPVFNFARNSIYHHAHKIDTYNYSVDPMHRSPLFREIQYIADRPWPPNFPEAKKKKEKFKNIICFLFYLTSERKKNVFRLR